MNKIPKMWYLTWDHAIDEAAKVAREFPFPGHGPILREEIAKAIEQKKMKFNDS